MVRKIIDFMFRLTILCVITSFILAYVYKKTKPKIEQQLALIDNQAKKTLIPVADRFEQINELYTVAYDKNNNIVGKIVKSSERGYGGFIKIMVGIDNKKMVTSVMILEQYETPGLGDEILKSAFIEQFKNKTQTEIVLRKQGVNISAKTGATETSQKGYIDAITGATISSKAVVNAVRKALEYLDQYEQQKQ